MKKCRFTKRLFATLEKSLRVLAWLIEAIHGESLEEVSGIKFFASRLKKKRPQMLVFREMAGQKYRVPQKP